MSHEKIKPITLELNFNERKSFRRCRFIIDKNNSSLPLEEFKVGNKMKLSREFQDRTIDDFGEIIKIRKFKFAPQYLGVVCQFLITEIF